MPDNPEISEIREQITRNYVFGVLCVIAGMAVNLIPVQPDLTLPKLAIGSSISYFGGHFFSQGITNALSKVGSLSSPDKKIE